MRIRPVIAILLLTAILFELFEPSTSFIRAHVPSQSSHREHATGALAMDAGSVTHACTPANRASLWQRTVLPRDPRLEFTGPVSESKSSVPLGTPCAFRIAVVLTYHLGSS